MGRFVRTTLGARVIATKRRLSEPEQLRKTAGIPTSPSQLLFTNGDGEFDPKCLARRHGFEPRFTREIGKKKGKRKRRRKIRRRYDGGMCEVSGLH